ncbi:hypothetical protein BH10BAC5_BH10BAC5_15900 [soil metagenome]
MNRSIRMLAAIAIPVIVLTFSCLATAQKVIGNQEIEIRVANEKFYSALNSMFKGELEPMNEIWSHGSDVTDLGPFGDRLVGWDDVGNEFKREAAMKLGGKVVCKDLLIYAGNEMGYTVCVEEGENMDAGGKPVVVKFRATNIFQLQNGKWKLVHHHTDLSAPLQNATEEKN